ncbi:MAG: O-antigen ligase family protein [Candidatus Rokuibacteriota bacterium]
MWLLLLMIVVMPYENNPYLYIAPSLLGIIPDFTVIKVLGLLGFGWALVRIASGAVPEGILSSRQAWLFLALVVGIVLAGILSGTGFVAVTRYVAFLLFMPFVLASVRTHADLRRVVYAVTLSLALTFPYAVRQMLRYDSRMGVGLYEPNYFAANLVLVIPLALAIAGTQSTPGRRKLWLAIGLILTASLFMTSSRGGFLGLLVAGTVFVYRRRGAGAALALVGVLVLAALPTHLGERAIATLFGEGPEASVGLEASNRAHMALFWGALRMISDAPLTGVGPYNFKTLSAAYSGLDANYIAHNTWLELAAEAGLPVLVVFLLLLVAVFRGLRRAVAVREGGAEARELAAWAEGLRSGLVGFLVVATFISAQYEKWFWLAVFLSIAMERLAAGHEWAGGPAQGTVVGAGRGGAPPMVPLRVGGDAAMVRVGGDPHRRPGPDAPPGRDHAGRGTGSEDA